MQKSKNIINKSYLPYNYFFNNYDKKTLDDSNKMLTSVYNHYLFYLM